MGGGQYQQALNKLLEIEKQPIKSLQNRKEIEEKKYKLFQEFKTKFGGLDSAIREISNFKSFRELKVDLGDGTNVASVTVDKNVAEPGSYSIEVEQLARRAGMISNNFEDPEAKDLGIGYVKIYADNGDDFEVFIDEDNASLSGVAKAINRVSESPVRAAVVKDASNPDKPYRLLLTAKNSGESNDLTFPDFYFLNGDMDFSIDDDRGAENAIVKIDDFEIELDSNDVPNFLPGVNMHLKQARPDQPFTLTITEDYQKISGKMKNLVDQINTILEFIVKQNQVDEKSDTKTMFTGDTILQTIEYRIRNLLHEGFGAGDPDDEDHFKIFHLNDLGVQFSKSGNLLFAEDKFQNAMEKDFKGVAEAVTGEMGMAYQLKTVVEGYTRGLTGLLATRDKGLRERINSIDRQIEEKERQYERKANALTDKFAKMQSTLSNLQRQQAYMQASLGGGGNPISQLLGG